MRVKAEKRKWGKERCQAVQCCVPVPAGDSFMRSIMMTHYILSRNGHLSYWASWEGLPGKKKKTKTQQHILKQLKLRTKHCMYMSSFLPFLILFGQGYRESWPSWTSRLCCLAHRGWLESHFPCSMMMYLIQVQKWGDSLAEVASG